MVLAWILFFFVTLGLKLALALAAIYLLLPGDGRCPACDGEMLPLLTPRGWRRLARCCRVQRRWCFRCNDVLLCRYRPVPAFRVGPPVPRPDRVPR